MRKCFGIKLIPTQSSPKTPPPSQPLNNQVVINITDVMRLCWLIHKYGKTEGIPKVVNGYCQGYQVDENNDEPCENCKECKFNQFYED